MKNAKSRALEVKRESWMRDKDYSSAVKREKHAPARQRLEAKDSSSKGHLGLSERGVYRHNPKTGFSELVHKRTGKFTGKSPY